MDVQIWMWHFIDDQWVPCNVIVAFFQARDTSCATLTIHVKSLVVEFNLTNKIITYVKDEGINLNTLAVALTSVVSSDSLQLDTPYPRTCFAHVMSKACQYAINHDQVSNGMHELILKGVQSYLQSTITWTKES
jgi:hypothetical protein